MAGDLGDDVVILRRDLPLGKDPDRVVVRVILAFIVGNRTKLTRIDEANEQEGRYGQDKPCPPDAGPAPRSSILPASPRTELGRAAGREIVCRSVSTSG